jgi:hypothetical protein
MMPRFGGEVENQNRRQLNCKSRKPEERFFDVTLLVARIANLAKAESNSRCDHGFLILTFPAQRKLPTSTFSINFPCDVT